MWTGSGRRKTRTRCMARLPNMSAAKFLASARYRRIEHGFEAEVAWFFGAD